MARRDLYIPEEVKISIKQHLNERCKEALYGYESANEEEDALTGDLGATLRARNQKVIIDNIESKYPGTWVWSMNYHKVRGRGPRATENIIGADGIFELTLNIGNITEKKSILFQTKKDWDYDQNILAQSLKLTNWREAAFILNFTSSEYEVFYLDTVIHSRGKKPANRIHTLAKFLGEDFLNCIVGDVNLTYDSKLRRLTWLTMQEEFVTASFSIPHKIALKITAPNPNGLNRMIPHHDIFNHRMNASPEELLSLDYGFTESELRKARAQKAKSFHLDVANVRDDLLEQLHNMRMQEFNNAYDLLKQKLKK